MTVKNKKKELFSTRIELKKSTKKRKIKTQDAINKNKKKVEAKLDLMNFKKLTFDELSLGQVLFACISSVSDFEMTLSLPDRLHGYLPITNISKAYKNLLTKVAAENFVDESVRSLPELYKPGQFICAQVCRFVKVKDRNKVEMSIMPKHINPEMKHSITAGKSVLQCSVESVEDKGYIMETGLSNIRSAFLPKSEAPPDISVGSTFLCSVREVSGEGEMVLKLSSNLKTNETESDTRPFIYPGAIVSATIKKVLPQGLLVSVGSSKGVIVPEHLYKPWDLLTNYSAKQKLKVRVLYVTYLSHIIHLSIIPRICDGRCYAPDPELTVGRVFDKAKVYKSCQTGVFLELSNGSYGYCPGTTCVQGKISDATRIKRRFPVGRIMPCRIIKFVYLDQCYVVNVRKNAVEEKFFDLNDLDVGQVLKVVIKKHTESGTFVAISEHLSGFVPKIHLTDTSMPNPQKKYPIAKEVLAKVIRLNVKYIHLTLKPSLVKSELPILKEIDKTKIGDFVEGVICKITNRGILVEFPNALKGFVHKRHTGVTEDLSEHFTIGKVLKSQILRIFHDDCVMLTIKNQGKFLNAKKLKKNKAKVIKDSHFTEEVDKEEEFPEQKAIKESNALNLDQEIDKPKLKKKPAEKRKIKNGYDDNQKELVRELAPASKKKKEIKRKGKDTQKTKKILADNKKKSLSLSKTGFIFEASSELVSIKDEVESDVDISRNGTTDEGDTSLDSKDPSTWTETGSNYFREGNLKEARETLQTALKKLPREFHTDVVKDFAKKEFEYGDSDRGVQLYESLIDSFPDQLNIWTEYSGTLVQENKIASARSVFERMSALDLPLPDMKNIFMNFEKFEKEHGTAKSVTGVKKKAAKYISSVMKI